jgi:multiple sugar transport system ATP-binding protein
MSKVTFDGVTKVYEGGEVAVQDFTLELVDGEFLTIVGPSGSGKSTALRMVAGLEDITEGDIFIRDRRINDVPAQDRDIAMVFQNYALYPHMSVRKNMSYGLKMGTDLPEDEIERRVDEAAEMMGISDLMDDRPEQLSGGQQQRVATGRAIVREPEVFLMDEPLSNLDAKLRTHMRIELQRIQEDLATTTIYVTHDQEEALTMSDRVAVLNEGELQQVGTPEEVYNEPANHFVADFVGNPSMNFFDVALEDRTLVELGGSFEYQLPADIADTVNRRTSGGEFIFGIRPEAIEITDDKSAETVEGHVDVVELVGSDNFVYLTINDESCILRTPADGAPEEGETVSITFNHDNVHLFDPETRENLTTETQVAEPPEP